MEDEKKNAAYDALFRESPEPCPGYDDRFDEFGNRWSSEDNPHIYHYNVHSTPIWDPLAKDFGYGKETEKKEK